MTGTRSGFAALSRGLKQATVLAGLLAAGSAMATPPPPAEPGAAISTADGVLKIRSAYTFDETVTRIEAAVRENKIRFFGEIDQANLAATAKINLRPSKLLLFGNPPLGVQLLTANPLAGLDWPVRMLVTQDADGSVWVAWTDFGFIAHRYGIIDRPAVVAMATKVAGLIAGITKSR
jgi:uncharacterized protein (DUF302 family)